MLDKLTLDEATALLDASPVATLLTTADGSINGFNTAFAGLLGETADTLTNDLLAPLLGQGTVVNWIMPDGDERWLAVECVSLGECTARFYTDVTEKLRLKKERDNCSEELRDQSLHDEKLTSILNRRGILVSLEPLVARSRRYNSPLSVVAMGLETGSPHDKALMQVSYLLKDQTRWADLVGCNSDGDFILILQETTQDSALLLVEKLTTHLQRMSEDRDAPVSASYGVTHCQKNDDAETILNRAEAALTEARSNQSGTAIAV
ncbi:MAG: GGDEF domain-containing protein [Pseudomonadota bacterium]